MGQHVYVAEGHQRLCFRGTDSNPFLMVFYGEMLTRIIFKACPSWTAYRDMGALLFISYARERLGAFCAGL